MRSRHAALRATCTLGLLLLAPRATRAQEHTPQVGYLFPAGARQGATLRAMIGGQNLGRPDAVYVSGKGVSATVIQYTRPYGRLNPQQKHLLLAKLWERQNEWLRHAHVQISDIDAFERTLREKRPWRELNREVDTDVYKLPEHPLLMQIDTADLRTLHHIQSYFFFPNEKLQENRQIGEHVVIELKIAATAPQGVRELRLITPEGISNPLRFQIDSLPEKRETEPNDALSSTARDYPPAIAAKLAQVTHALPLLMNGQIMPGDVDRIRFRATRGEEITARIYARALIPYLADAVPGWFQCVMSLCDAEGRELAYADDNAIDPDPTLAFTVPDTGDYVLTVRDAIYRGRQDFVYRLSLTGRTHPELPGVPPPDDLYTPPVNSLKPPREKEPNNRTAQAMLLHAPQMINGSIAHPGDVDIFRIQGRQDATIVAETYARRLGSPLDALLRLTDADGEVIAWNDDFVIKENHLHIDHTGLTTHHADAYLSATFPRNGDYFLQLSDAQGDGSDQHAYRLRVSPPQPDFDLRVTPSGIAGGRHANVPVTVHVLRQDGLDAPIDLELLDAPRGARLIGGGISRGATTARLTLVMPDTTTDKPVPIRIRGTARHGNTHIRRVALPADNVMQAFLWRHLVPAEELLLVTTKRWNPVPPLVRSQARPVQLAAGASQPVLLRSERPFRINTSDGYSLTLDTPPAGVSLVETATRISPREWHFTLLYTPPESTAKVPPPQNLIIQIIREYTPPPREGRPTPTRRREPIGYLPAIPVVFLP